MIYLAPLLLSVVCALMYALIWHKHFDAFFTLIFTCVPISELGFFLTATSRSLEAALIANKIAYVGGCFLPLFITMSIIQFCKLNVPRSVKVGLIFSSFLIQASTITMGSSNLFYRSCDFEVINNIGVITNKRYGPFHDLFLAVMITCMSIGFLAIIYSYINKKDVSRKMLIHLFVPELISIVGFFGQKALHTKYEIVPFALALALVDYLIIVYRVELYNINDTVIDSLVETGDTGILSLDLSYHYLGSNETARLVFPELRQIAVDDTIKGKIEFSDKLIAWSKKFSENERLASYNKELDDKFYHIDIRYLMVSGRKRGYQFFITDNTDDQKYIKLLDNYNSQLEADVAKHTERIVKMHDKLILSMAMMVESRDNSTGGHIMRTSECVKILVNEIRMAGDMELPDKYCNDMIKAAPMHDLGKVAVDDAILRKPGKFTPEEFEKMKIHAEEGAKTVHKILEDTDDRDFAKIAENVAHYHHERWDGSGYPDGLKGTQIPLEARIMAIADVYDALVSKRVYKEKMSFEQADNIILDSMGKHFDKSLEKYYVSARPKLEEYYRSLE